MSIIVDVLADQIRDSLSNGATLIEWKRALDQVLQG